MQQLLELYRDRLTDLTKKNPSLRLLRLANKNHCDICSFEAGQTGSALRIAGDIFSLKAQIPLLPVTSFDEESILINRRLTYLKREIDLIEQETGTNPFYVAYGFLEGSLLEDFYLRSPVLLFPARLTRKMVQKVIHWVIEMDEENLPFFNPTLLLAFRKYLGIDMIEELKRDDMQIPNENVLEFIATRLKQYRVKVDYEAEDLIQTFKFFKSDEIPKDQKGFVLKPNMVMGKFRQSASTLLHDYEHLLEYLPTEGLLYRLLNETPSEEQLEEVKPEILNTVQEEDTFFVLDTDASQEAAVVASRNRDGLIVHGPPGTGKSQVIVNLIADRLARGQRVLLVCQKPVALDVVYNRLSSISLQHHVALVHDFNASKRTVYAKVGNVLQREVFPAVTEFERISHDIQTLSGNLNAVASTLHQERTVGRTLYWLYTHGIWDQNFIFNVTDILEGVTYGQLQDKLTELKSFFLLMQKYDHPQYPWSKRKSFASFTNHTHLTLRDLLSQFFKDVEQAQSMVTTEFAYTPDYYCKNRDAVESLAKATSIVQDRNIYKHVHMFYADEEREFEHDDQIHKVKQGYQHIFKQLERLRDLPEPISHMTEALAKEWGHKFDQFVNLEKKVTRFVTGSWYSLKKELRDHCQSQQILFDGSSVRRYKAGIDAYLQYETMRNEAKKLHIFSDLPLSNDFDEWDKWLRLKKYAIEFLELYVEAQTAFPNWLNDLKSKDDIDGLVTDSFAHHLKSVLTLIQLTQRMNETMVKVRSFIDDEQVDDFVKQLNGGIYDLAKYRELLDAVNDFDSLIRLDKLKGSLEPVSKVLIERCAAKAPIEQTLNIVEHWSKIIENSFIYAWIEAIEQGEPHIADVSTEMYETYRDTYRSLLKKKRGLIPQFVDNRVATTATQIERTTRTKLKHESGKKRSQAPLRQVIGAFTEDVLKLIPCWLCTPEVVSALFPSVEGMFDLVIFDEASQCPVENAIPAIFRAKQVVIAGDEKQLPPTNMFALADDEDEEDEGTEYKDNTDRQANQLLEWGKPRFADQWLTWHYRSKHDALINFSNYAFYGQRMQTAPIAKVHDQKPIEFVRVDGKWIGNQNRVEAEKLVDILIDTLEHDDSRPTLGVITFNAKQAELINDVLDERSAADPHVQALIDQAKQRKDGDEFVGLFVKNIENVQGDERDIILFSVAYAKDEQGKMVSQFGSLSKDLGENRLNVAITRARSKVYLVCSFEPSEWTRVDTYTNRGPRLLKKYLEYGKAISDADMERVQLVLDSILDATAVQDIGNQAIHDSPFEEQVCTELKKLGYTVHTQVGFSGYKIDLAVVHPNSHETYTLGIECDGAMFHSSKVARERDLYRQRFLEQHGWTIHRIWSRNWWKAKDKEIAKVQSVIQRLLVQTPESHKVLNIEQVMQQRAAIT